MLAERVMEWTEQWKEQGLQQGEATLLARLAERRFGPLPASVRERIEGADAKTLLCWGENLLAARSLDEIFTDP